MVEINKKIKNMIESNPLALATVNSENKPHIIVVSCVKIINWNIIITDNYMRKTKENILINPNVSLVVWNNEQGFEIIGTARYYNSGKWLEFVKNLEENKGMPAKAAIIVKINKISKLLG